MPESNRLGQECQREINKRDTGTMSSSNMLKK